MWSIVLSIVFALYMLFLFLIAFLANSLSIFWLGLFLGGIIYTLVLAIYIKASFMLATLAAGISLSIVLFLIIYFTHEKIKKRAKILKYFLGIIIFFVTSRVLFYNIFDYKGLHNIDFGVHLNAIQSYILGRSFSLNLTKVHPLFTLFTYLPVFHFVFGGALFSLDPQQIPIVLFITQNTFMLIVNFITFVVLYKLSRNKLAAFLATIFSMFIFDLDGSFTTYFLLPQTLSSIFGFYLLFLVYKNINVINKVQYWLGFVLLFLSHFLIGGIWCVLIIAYIILKKIDNKFILYTTFTLLLMLFLESVLGIFSFLNVLQSIFPHFVAQRTGDYVTYSSLQFLDHFILTYSILGAFLILAAILNILISGNQKNIIVVILYTIIIDLMIGNFLFAQKFWIVLHFLTLILIVKILSLTLSPKNSKLLVVLASTIFVINAFVTLYSQLEQYKERETFTGKTYKLVLDFEFNIAKDLNNLIHNKNKCIFLSNPTTMFFVDGLSLCDSLHGYATPQFDKQLIYIALKQDQISLLNGIKELKQYKDVYIVYSLRTKKWLETLNLEKLKDFRFGIWTLEQNLLNTTINCPEYSDAILIKEARQYCIYKIK